MLISFIIIYLISICKYEKDEKLAKLAPLMAKFEKVTLNGSQKMTAVGWEEVRYDPSHDVFIFTLIIQNLLKYSICFIYVLLNFILGQPSADLWLQILQVLSFASSS